MGLDEGYVASDNPFGVGGCIDRWACIITGFWQSDIPVPEPGTLALLITGLLSAWLTGGSTMRWTVVAPQSGTTSPARLFAD